MQDGDAVHHPEIFPSQGLAATKPSELGASIAIVSGLDKSNRVWNVPNALSMVRLLLAIMVGVLIEWGSHLPAMILFIMAAATDYLDGWWARRYQQITRLGRVLDPFVDKIIIMAALIALVGQAGSQIAAWMVTLILGREMLVTSIRAMVEGKGGDFSARWLGKWKMVVQCALIIASLWLLASPQTWLQWITIALAWSAVAITLASGADYIAQALRQSPNA